MTNEVGTFPQAESTAAFWLTDSRMNVAAF
jgi:hypothetical protein